MWSQIKALFGPRGPDPQVMGDLLLYRLLDDQFGVRVDEVTRELPERIRDNAAGWVLIYLAWVFRHLLAASYGTTSPPEIMDAVAARIDRRRGEEEVKQVREVVELEAALRYWFQCLDRTEATPQGTPHVAAGFLIGDPDSPYYRQTEPPPDDVWFAVAGALDAARAQAEPAMQKLITGVWQIGPPRGLTAPDDDENDQLAQKLDAMAQQAEEYERLVRRTGIASTLLRPVASLVVGGGMALLFRWIFPDTPSWALGVLALAVAVGFYRLVAPLYDPDRVLGPTGQKISDFFAIFFGLSAFVVVNLWGPLLLILLIVLYLVFARHGAS